MNFKYIIYLLTMNYSKCEQLWHPWQLLHPKDNTSDKYGILVLNTPIHWKPVFLLPLWKKAAIKVLVDGGSNRWFNWLQQNNVLCRCVVCVPTLVTGDMDSIEKNILDGFINNGITNVIRTPNQNETDFTKAIRETKNHAIKINEQITNIISIVDTCGRLDQIMGNIQTLFLCQKIVSESKVFLLAADSLSWIIAPGKHKIIVPEELKKNWCALIPVGSKCANISTTGLKWNLENQSLCFGELVSTSNTYNDLGYVTIDTNDYVLWSMGLNGIPSNYKE